MHQLTLEQFRTTAATGAVLSVTLRGFANPIKALALLRELGIRESRVETTDWRPEEAEIVCAD